MKSSQKKQLSFLVRKFINHLMKDGKKNKAEKIFFSSLALLREKENKNPFFVFLLALKNSLPYVEVRSIRRGGATYQIPVPLYEHRALSLAMKWILQCARKKGKSMSVSLSQSILEASKNQGDSVKKREALHALALKNRSLSHFRWF